MAQGGMARPLDRFAFLVMSGLCVAWGGNQVAAKVALVDFGPMTQCALRNGLGAVLVAIYAAVARPNVFRRDGAAALGAIAGVLFTLEFVFLFFAVERTTAASAARRAPNALSDGAGLRPRPPNRASRPPRWSCINR
jgi:drug/metabolite transporter (DMT)-like permease